MYLYHPDTIDHSDAGSTRRRPNSSLVSHLFSTPEKKYIYIWLQILREKEIQSSSPALMRTMAFVFKISCLHFCRLTQLCCTFQCLYSLPARQLHRLQLTNWTDISISEVMQKLCTTKSLKLHPSLADFNSRIYQLPGYCGQKNLSLSTFIQNSFKPLERLQQALGHNRSYTPF